MTNAEKYKNDILSVAFSHTVAGVDLENNKIMPCSGENCYKCKFSHENNKDVYSCDERFVKWIGEEYKIDWSKVPVDTKVLVKNEMGIWAKRYFAKYEFGKVYTFGQGATSWSNNSALVCWVEAKLAEDEVE